MIQFMKQRTVEGKKDNKIRTSIMAEQKQVG
jgi:hypothetical protein